jgi:predicted esterase
VVRPAAGRRAASALGRALLLASCWLSNAALWGCRNQPELPQPLPEAPRSIADAEGARVEPHPTSSSAVPQSAPKRLPPLAGAWLERLKDGEQPLIVTPPVGAVAPSRLIVGVHGAGDRPEWSCGGWRLASQAGAFVVCPQGARMSTETFAWASAQQLAERVDASVNVAKARYESYVDSAPFIYAGFSQGATLAEPFLLKNAARFPIVILAEGGYATARSPAFARAFYAAGGRRVVLVCGGTTCFRSAREAKKVLESAKLQVLIVGDEKAGHNLNERMQKALQAAWPEIAASLPPG